MLFSSSNLNNGRNHSGDSAAPTGVTPRTPSDRRAPSTIGKPDNQRRPSLMGLPPARISSGGVCYLMIRSGPSLWKSGVQQENHFKQCAGVKTDFGRNNAPASEQISATAEICSDTGPAEICSDTEPARHRACSRGAEGRPRGAKRPTPRGQPWLLASFSSVGIQARLLATASFRESAAPTIFVSCRRPIASLSAR